MKTKSIITAIALLGLSLSVSAQQDEKSQKSKERVESMKIAFITQRLSLTPEEAKVFWPVYTQCQNEMKALRDKSKDERKNAREHFDEMSDKDIEKLVDNEMALKQDQFDIRKKYHAEFKKVLPMRKVALLYKSEEDFKKELLTRLHDEGHHDQHHGDGGYMR